MFPQPVGQQPYGQPSAVAVPQAHGALPAQRPLLAERRGGGIGEQLGGRASPHLCRGVAQQQPGTLVPVSDPSGGVQEDAGGGPLVPDRTPGSSPLRDGCPKPTVLTPQPGAPARGRQSGGAGRGRTVHQGHPVGRFTKRSRAAPSAPARPARPRTSAVVEPRSCRGSRGHGQRSGVSLLTWAEASYRRNPDMRRSRPSGQTARASYPGSAPSQPRASAPLARAAVAKASVMASPGPTTVTAAEVMTGTPVSGWRMWQPRSLLPEVAKARSCRALTTEAMRPGRGGWATPTCQGALAPARPRPQRSPPPFTQSVHPRREGVAT